MYDNIIKLYELEHIRTIIDSIETISNDDEINLKIKLLRVNESCSNCGSTSYTIKDYYLKKIVHSISMTRKVYILFNQRRYQCKLCHKYFYESNPFSSTNEGTSILTVMNVLEYLKDYNHTFSSTAKMFNISLSTVLNIFDSHVKPRKGKLPRVLSIDEIHIKANIKYPYACVLLDFEKNKLVDVIKSRRKLHLENYFEQFKSEELNTVEYVTMDLWAPYKHIVQRYMPKAKIVADAFHVVVLINRILDNKRRKVMKQYIIENEDKDLNYKNDFGYLLKKFSWMIRLSPEKIKNKSYWINKYKFSVWKNYLLEHLLSSNDELREIYNLRNMYIENNNTTDYSNAEEMLNEQIRVFRNHQIDEIKECGRTLSNWKKEIINSFQKHDNIRYSNGRLEGKNRAIKTIIRNAYGYKNFERFRARVLYSINKDVPLKLNK